MLFRDSHAHASVEYGTRHGTRRRFSAIHMPTQAWSMAPGDSHAQDKRGVWHPVTLFRDSHAQDKRGAWHPVTLFRDSHAHASVEHGTRHGTRRRFSAIHMPTQAWSMAPGMVPGDAFPRFSCPRKRGAWHPAGHPATLFRDSHAHASVEHGTRHGTRHPASGRRQFAAGMRDFIEIFRIRSYRFIVTSSRDMPRMCWMYLPTALSTSAGTTRVACSSLGAEVMANPNGGVWGKSGMLRRSCMPGGR